MAIRRRTLGRHQVFSNTEVGAGWMLYTYTRGGLNVTNKATYQDPDGQIPHTNPIIFDGRGEADIWWNGEYDIRLTDDLGNLIWTLEDVGAGEDVPNSGNFNQVSNGGFEDDSNGDGLPDFWTITEYPSGGIGAGVVVIDNSTQVEGSNSLRFTSVGDGGGLAESDFFEVTENDGMSLSWMMRSSVNGVRNLVEMVWYTSAQVQLSITSIYDNSITNPTAWAERTGNATAPPNARFARVRLTGAHSSDPTAGITWFDRIRITNDLSSLNINGTLNVTVGDSSASADPNTGLTVEDNGDVYASLLTPNGNQSGVLFGDPESNLAGFIIYRNNDDTLRIGADGVERLRLDNERLAVISGAIDERKGADIASSTITNIADADGNFIDITGAVTITQFGTAQAGAKRTVQFDGSLTLTHNAGLLILPGGVNIITRAGDIAEFISLGSGVWVCSNYSGAPRSQFVTDSGRPVISNTSFDVVANIANNTWESVGDTPSGADNIWSALDTVPDNIDWIEVKGVVGDNGADTSPTIQLHARPNGSTAGPSGASIIGSANLGLLGAGSTNSNISSSYSAKINVTDKVFDLYWPINTGNFQSASMYLVGYGYNR